MSKCILEEGYLLDRKKKIKADGVTVHEITETMPDWCKNRVFALNITHRYFGSGVIGMCGSNNKIFYVPNDLMYDIAHYDWNVGKNRAIRAHVTPSKRIALSLNENNIVIPSLKEIICLYYCLCNPKTNDIEPYKYRSNYTAHIMSFTQTISKYKDCVH